MRGVGEYLGFVEHQQGTHERTAAPQSLMASTPSPSSCVVKPA
jgi:hypothetical protein